MNRLFTKFLIGFLIFAGLSFGVIAIYTYKMAYNNTLELTGRELRSTASAISAELSDYYDGRDAFDEDYLSRMTWYHDLSGSTVWIADPNGCIIFDSADRFTGMTIPDFDPAADVSYYVTGDFFDMFSEDQITVCSHITANFSIFGYLYIHEPLAHVDTISNNLIVPTYITFVIILCLSLILLVMLYVLVIKPLKKISSAADEYASGNFGYKLDIRSRDEIGYLAETLNNMASDLGRNEEYQREFISNVSHDFRSPLTSIKGYLEAILDGTIPPELQSKYLNIVITETERLTGLTTNMLKLNSLGQSSSKLEFSDFSANDAIKDSCASFEGICGKRGITFDLYFSEPCLKVHADRSRILQVLYNLIDNAIKFSPDNSVITIEAFDRYDKVFISVKDQGIGIARENIKKIWNRFYKSDESRGKDKKGTGLGLAIVKEIITAHGEDIDVISTPGVGTEFIFRLTSADGEAHL